MMLQTTRRLIMALLVAHLSLRLLPPPLMTALIFTD